MATNEDPDCPPAYTPPAMASRGPERKLPKYAIPVFDCGDDYTFGDIGAPLTRHPELEPEVQEPHAGETEKPQVGEIQGPQVGETGKPQNADAKEPQDVNAQTPEDADVQEPQDGACSDPSEDDEELARKRDEELARIKRDDDLSRIMHTIFARFWEAVRTGDTEKVRQMIETDGIISSRAMYPQGMTPLTRAICNGHLEVVKLLVNLGEDVNAFGMIQDDDFEDLHRTPLQVAALTGHFLIARYLFEDCGADDSIIAPDGELALRLAADGGYREIVELLPIRRGGGKLRWKTKKDKAMKKAIRSAKKLGKFLRILFWELPYYSLLWVPYKAGKWAWKHREDIAGYFVVVLMEVPRLAWKAVKELPLMIADLFGWLLKHMKKAPEKIKEVAKLYGSWLVKAFPELGKAAVEIFKRLLSVLHTVVVAMFHKDLTVRDVWNGFCMLVRAVFVSLPKTVAKKLEDLAETTYEALKKALGFFGRVAATIFEILSGMIAYIPRQLAKIWKALAEPFAAGFHEAMVWYDPKW